jgi:hypothetical protein
MSDVLHSCAPLPLIPPAPFSHKGRRGSLGVLMAEMGDGTQGLAKKSTPVRGVAVGVGVGVRVAVGEGMAALKGRFLGRDE